MNIKHKLNTLTQICKKTNPFIYIPQLFWWKLFKKPIFKKLTVDGLIYNTIDSDDLSHLNEYVLNYYNIENIKKINICVDIGANSGDFSLFISKKSKKVYSFEPITEVYEKMNNNIADNHITNITTFNFGISSSCGSAKLLIPKNHTGGAKISTNGTYKIKIISWKKLYELIGKPKQIDLLKMDCEGCEYSLLSDPFILDYIKEIRLEMHVFNKNDENSAKKLKNLFFSKGFVCTNLSLKELNNNNALTLEYHFIKNKN